MLDKNFILENIDEIAELRDFNEVYEYFVSHGMEVNSAEIMSLKDSPNLANKLEVNSQVLTMQQLECVAGGWDSGDTGAVATGVFEFGAIIAAILLPSPFTIGTAIFGGVALVTSIWADVEGKKKKKQQYDKTTNDAMISYGISHTNG